MLRLRRDRVNMREFSAPPWSNFWKEFTPICIPHPPIWISAACTEDIYPMWSGISWYSHYWSDEAIIIQGYFAMQHPLTIQTSLQRNGSICDCGRFVAERYFSWQWKRQCTGIFLFQELQSINPALLLDHDFDIQCSHRSFECNGWTVA